jgi:integrase
VVDDTGIEPVHTHGARHWLHVPYYLPFDLGLLGGFPPVLRTVSRVTGRLKRTSEYPATGTRARANGDSMGQRSGFGSVRRLPSGRWQARYTDQGGTSRSAPFTFHTKQDAQAWLTTVRADLIRGQWLPPDADTTLRQYASVWLEHRTLKDRTREHYRKILDQLILPALGEYPLRKLTPAIVRQWHARTAPDRPTYRAHAYQLLRTICASAVSDDLIVANPCRIRGAGQAKRASKTEPATLEELAIIVDAMPERYRLMVLLASWCGLRFGELTELRGHDIDTKKGIIRVRRAVVWVDSKADITTPKSAAGERDVAIPPHMLPLVREHLLRHGGGRGALLFPAAHTDTHMRPATLTRVWYPAREAAGRPDLHFHDLRHTGAVLAAGTGATLAELMGRLGHSTPGAAMRYQHRAKGRDQEIAEALSKLAEST